MMRASLLWLRKLYGTYIVQYMHFYVYVYTCNAFFENIQPARLNLVISTLSNILKVRVTAEILVPCWNAYCAFYALATRQGRQLPAA